MSATVKVVALFGLSLLHIGGGPGTAAAGDLHLRGGWHPVQPPTGTAPARFASVVPPTGNEGDDSAVSGPTTTGAIDRDSPAVPMRPMPLAQAVKAEATSAPAIGTAQLGKEPEPWCRSGRIIGSGAGFCLIN